LAKIRKEKKSWQGPKTTTKITRAKKTTKATTRARATANIKLLSAIDKASATTKRPHNNPEAPQATIDHINGMLNDLKTILDAYAQHLRSLDRMRLNGVGIKKGIYRTCL